MHSPGSPLRSSREQAQQCLQTSQRKSRSSFLGRKQGLAFFGFYASQESESQGNKLLSLLTGFFSLFAPLQNKAHHSLRTARSLAKRHRYHHWRLIHMPVLVLSGSFSDCQLNAHHTANRKRDWREGNNIYPGDSLPAPTDTLL